jgi:hypothetical protein
MEEGALASNVPFNNIYADKYAKENITSAIFAVLFLVHAT